MESLLQQSGWWLGHAAAVLLCLSGILVSLFAFSGTWLVAGASVILIWCRPDGAPGWWVAGAFFALSAALEVFDFFAGNLGITKRGGSMRAGWAALFGGILGMIVGSFAPVPIISSILGMLLGSFLFAYWVERARLKQDLQAARIARGAVWARLWVMFVKTCAALGMTMYLWYDVLFNS
ncbi:MAG TPA: DUF456 domain-containing protein [Kiritimatiellia bacterium]|nr:DUF456 domain-containing protein [Kiritimatiellia bacterium]